MFFSELLPPQECAKVIEETGMGIELIRPSVGMNLDRFGEMMQEIRADLSAWGNPEVSVHGPFLDLNPMSYESMVQSAAMYRFEQAYDAAKQLDAKRIVFHSGMIPQTVFLEGWAERMAEFWNRFMDGKSGLTVCMENVFDPEIEPLARMISNVESEWFGLCLDVGHANCYSDHCPEEWAKKLGGRIRHLHVHDNLGDCDAHLAIGDGTVAITEVYKYIEETPTIETRKKETTTTIENSRLEDVLTSYERLRKMRNFTI